MAGDIRQFFETDYPLNKEGLEELFSLFKTQTYEKGEELIIQGKTDSQLRFLNSGVIREFYTKDGKEININFFTESQFITDFTSFINEIPTKKNQETLSKTELLVIDKKVFCELLQRYQCGKDFIDLTFQKLLEEKELFEYNRITKSPEDLYNELRIYKPDWLQKIPQYHIASYLGITPETLSRIRSKN